MALVDEINRNLNGLGAIVLSACKANGVRTDALTEDGKLDVADICSLLDHESYGGKNIFGHDKGVDLPDAPPYSGHPVTLERVEKLINQPGYREGKAPMNGIGPPQITYYTLVLEAHKRGGAHLPEHQIHVAVKHLAYLVRKLGYTYGIAAYNVGEGNPQKGVDNGYFGKVMAKREEWKKLLRGEVVRPPEYPTTWLKSPGWQTDDQNRYARVKTRTKVLVDKNGWQYAMPIAYEPPLVSGGSWMQRHPTRYAWRTDVEEVIVGVLSRFPGTTVNTYVDHPEGYGLDNISFDVWGENGRGSPVGTARGQKVFDYLYALTSDPQIWWTIWNGWVWERGVGWKRYGDPSDTVTDSPHVNHIHVTYQ